MVNFYSRAIIHEKYLSCAFNWQQKLLQTKLGNRNITEMETGFMKITKFLFSLALATVTVSQVPMTAYAKDVTSKVVVEDEAEVSFSDVSPNHWAYKSIKELSQEYNILGGFPDGTFRGNRNITRYEAAAMIAQLVRKFDEVASKTKGGLLTKATLDKLKKEFSNELEDLQSEVKKIAKDQQDLQQDLDETKDNVEMLKEMMPKVKFMGDASVRYEALTNELGVSSDKFATAAPQARLRLGATADANGGFTFGTRITTSSANDVTNQFVSLGNMNSKLGINLDKLYVGFRPWDGALDLTVGRHGNPFTKTTELVWDDDFTFDGSYLKVRFGDMANHLCLVGGYDVFGIAGMTPANPRSGKHSFKDDATGTAGVLSGGLGLHLTGDMVSFQLGGNYHAFTNPNNLIGKSLSVNPRTNLLTADGKGHISQFKLATGSLAVSLFPKAYFPVTLHGDVSYNLGAGANAAASGAANTALVAQAKSQSLGYIAGLKLGKLEEAGNFMVGFNYKMVGTESVFAAFNEDQLGGSNIAAMEGQIGVQVAPMTTLMFTGQVSNKAANKTAADKDLYTIRTSVMHKF